MTDKEFWVSAGLRALRTFLQVILATWTAGSLITEVDWGFVLISAVSASIYSFITSIFLGLPEADYKQALIQIAEDRDPPETEDDEEEGDPDGTTEA